MLGDNKQLLTVPIKITADMNNITMAILDTGANCLCISHQFAKTRLSHIPLTDIHNKVRQASGLSIGAIGCLNLSYNIEDTTFTHRFIVCTKLMTPIIRHLDFAKAYHIGIDWNVESTPYLRHRGKYLVTAHPLKSMHIKTVDNQLQACTPETTADESSTAILPRKGRKMVHLVTKTQL